MPKIIYDGIKFDSQLEVDYYNYLKGLNLEFLYHPNKSIKITKNNVYTPDFIVIYKDRIEIVETKGYNQFSFMRDNIIHNYMNALEEKDLVLYVESLGIKVNEKQVKYRKIKYLSSIGFVDFDYKNPNTLSNKRKNKIIDLENELKEIKKELKDYQRYFDYKENKKKLTKPQEIWLVNFINEKNT